MHYEEITYLKIELTFKSLWNIKYQDKMKWETNRKFCSFPSLGGVFYFRYHLRVHCVDGVRLGASERPRRSVYAAGSLCAFISSMIALSAEKAGSFLCVLFFFSFSFTGTCSQCTATILSLHDRRLLSGRNKRWNFGVFFFRNSCSGHKKRYALIVIS